MPGKKIHPTANIARNPGVVRASVRRTGIGECIMMRARKRDRTVRGKVLYAILESLMIIENAPFAKEFPG